MSKLTITDLKRRINEVDALRLAAERQVAELREQLEDSASVLASELIHKLAALRGSPIEWAEAIAITAIITRMTPEEESRLLDLEKRPLTILNTTSTEGKDHE